MATKEDIEAFKIALNENRYDFVSLAYLLFPFGEPGSELEDMRPYDWQIEEWEALSRHLSNPATRFETYRFVCSSGNGAAKTAWGAMTILMLMYTQRVRGRITANTQPQMTSIVWPEYDLWFRRARYSDLFFEKFGTSIKARDEKYSETWRFDSVTWSEQSPASISGLHNKGGVAVYVFEEAPGIPSNIWKYAAGAFTETETIKLHFAFGNSDDPESQFEQNMDSPLWRSRRIDTRTLTHIDPKQVEAWLLENGGNEDADDFRVRVRGLPRKSAKDSIIKIESVLAAIDRGRDYDPGMVPNLPVVLGVDPAWTGGDETTIWVRRGPWTKLLEKFRLDKAAGQTHQYTYSRVCFWERELRADAVNIDQGEGTALYTLAVNDGKTHWQLFSFASSPTDAAEFKDSQYANLRAQMYYEGDKFLLTGGAITAEKPEYIEDIQKQLCWTKGGRHKTNQKKIAEPKLDIKARVGSSPDVADGFVLLFARDVTDRLPENDMDIDRNDRLQVGQGAYTMPDHDSPYMDADFEEY